MRRRSFMKGGIAMAAAAAMGPDFWRAAYAADTFVGDGPYGPLGEPDANGIRLPAGFSSRVLAESLALVPGTTYQWHPFPDGGATFPDTDPANLGGWAYTSNSEVLAVEGGGCSALKFDAEGEVIDAYRILAGTAMNCAGGPTPWGSWLSCEERPNGTTHECNPLAPSQGVEKPALGVFSHESVAVDPVGERLYLTEDVGDGRFYRFTPETYRADGEGVLDEGLLEVMVVGAEGDGPGQPDGLGAVTWVAAQNPDQPQWGNRIEGTRVFDGGEGTWYDTGHVYFTTKGTNQVFDYDIRREQLELLYDDDMVQGGEAPLTGVDNIVVSPYGDIIVAEDGGNLELVIITPDRTVTPLLKVEDQDSSELVGPAFDPSGTRLYFSSQRGGTGGLGGLTPNEPGSTGPGPGITYEVTGPFRLRRAANRAARAAGVRRLG